MAIARAVSPVAIALVAAARLDASPSAEPSILRATRQCAEITHAATERSDLQVRLVSAPGLHKTSRDGEAGIEYAERIGVARVGAHDLEGRDCAWCIFDTTTDGVFEFVMTSSSPMPSGRLLVGAYDVIGRAETMRVSPRRVRLLVPPFDSAIVHSVGVSGVLDAVLRADPTLAIGPSTHQRLEGRAARVEVCAAWRPSPGVSVPAGDEDVFAVAAGAPFVAGWVYASEERDALAPISLCELGVPSTSPRDPETRR